MAAVEAKTARRIGGSDASGLRSFAAENPEVPRYIVTPDARPHRRDDGILVTDWSDFLAQFRTWL